MTTYGAIALADVIDLDFQIVDVVAAGDGAGFFGCAGCGH